MTAILGVSLALGLTAAPALAHPASGSSVQSAPSPGQSSELNAVTAISKSDAWAVGSYCTSHCSAISAAHRYMILHWNGKTWSVALTGGCYSLAGISASSASNVWAVGTCSTGALLLHWNGKTWSRDNVPAFPPYATLDGVSVLSAANAWAVGAAYSAKAGGLTTFVAHWNGSKWTQQASPAIGVDSGIGEVSADRASDAWAAGTYCASGCGTARSVFREFIIRWNGKTWARSPLPLSNVSYIGSLQALSPSNAWAVGQAVSGSTYTPVMLHWNGAKWQRITFSVFASAMTFISASDGWAVQLGWSVAHWNGSKWTVGPQTLPNYGGSLYAASGDTSSDIWAIGERCATATCRGAGAIPITSDLILHWNGAKWSVY